MISGNVASLGRVEPDMIHGPRGVNLLQMEGSTNVRGALNIYVDLKRSFVLCRSDILDPDLGRIGIVSRVKPRWIDRIFLDAYNRWRKILPNVAGFPAVNYAHNRVR